MTRANNKEDSEKNTSKIESENAWNRILEEVGNDTWGKEYQIMMSKLKKTPPLNMTDDQQIEIAKPPFPYTNKIKSSTWKSGPYID